MNPSLPFRTAFFALALLTAAFLMGCGGGGGGAKAVVSGKVTVGNDAAMQGSTVTFHGAGTTQTLAIVDAEGKYSVADPPVGEVKITVKGPPVPTAEGATGMPGSTTPKGKAIPEKYETVGAGPTFTVKTGTQTFDIKLEP